MSLLGNTEYIKTKSGEFIEISRGMFHTHVTLPDGSKLVETYLLYESELLMEVM